MKTAIQKANKIFLELNPEEFYAWFWNNRNILLKIEREQIVDAQENGFTDGCRYTTGFEQTLWVDGEQYYNETFNTETNETI